MSAGELPPTRRTVLVLYFGGGGGGKHDILPQTVYESKCQGQLAGWLASLTLKDEERPDLDLPRVACKFVDVFPYEIPGLPPQRVIDFGISLHRALHHGALRFCLRRRRTRPFDCALIIDS